MSLDLRRAARERPVTTFAILAIALGWVVALPLVLSPAGLGVWSVNVPELWLVLVATTPTIAALVTQRLAGGSLRIASLGKGWARVVLGCLVGAALTLLACAIVPALVLSNGAVGALRWSAILAGSAAWWSNPINLLGGPINEEIGWRGYALPRLQDRFGALGASAIVAMLWMLWHIPLFLLPGWLSVPIWAFAVLLLCLSVLMTWVTNRSDGSVLPAIVMHAVFNSSFPILVGLCQGVPTREPGLTWYLVGVLLTTLGAIALTRGRLGRVERGAW